MTGRKELRRCKERRKGTKTNNKTIRAKEIQDERNKGKGQDEGEEKQKVEKIDKERKRTRGTK